MTSSKPFVVVVDGIIGSGKTTIIEKCLVPGLTDLKFKVAVVSEPVDLWMESGALEQFYKNPHRRGFQFQTRVFHDRIKRSQQCFENGGRSADVVLLERSIFTDVLFMKLLRKSKTVDETEYRDYMDLWTMWKELMPARPDLFVYVRPDLDVAMDRLKKRNRGGEQTVSTSYQKSLQEEHDKYFKDKYVEVEPGVRVPCSRLETNGNFRDDENTKKEIIRWFVKQMPGR